MAESKKTPTILKLGDITWKLDRNGDIEVDDATDEMYGHFISKADAERMRDWLNMVLPTAPKEDAKP